MTEQKIAFYVFLCLRQSIQPCINILNKTQSSKMKLHSVFLNSLVHPICFWQGHVAREAAVAQQDFQNTMTEQKIAFYVFLCIRQSIQPCINILNKTQSSKIKLHSVFLNSLVHPICFWQSHVAIEAAVALRPGQWRGGEVSSRPDCLSASLPPSFPRGLVPPFLWPCKAI